MRQILRCVLLTTLISATCQAAELAQGQLYASGTVVSSAPFGIEFSVPSGWQGGWPPGSEFFILESGTGARMLLYMAEDSLSNLSAQLAQPIQLDWQTVLTPKGRPVVTDGILHVGLDVSVAGVSASLLGREARPGLVITATSLAPDAGLAGVERVAKALILDFRATPPPTAPAQAATGGWDDVLAGQHLVRLYTGSGYSEEEHIYLCSDRSFYRTNNSGGFGAGASGAFGGRGQGRWQTRGDPATEGTLTLVYGAGSTSEVATPGFDHSASGPGGETVSFSLRFDGKKLMVNDRRWFRDTNTVCN